ncbi:MAG: hypothetical protein HQL51_12325, partial [Magnetococcales bacterium]|nr:hypothetical protein [Magnetococcales bacterium]
LPPPGRLQLTEGEAEPAEFVLKGGAAVVGKCPEAQIRLKGMFDPAVAAIIRRLPEGYRIDPPDEGARGKTLLNGAPLNASQPLNHGDQLEVRGTLFRFHLQADPAKPDR